MYSLGRLKGELKEGIKQEFFTGGEITRVERNNVTA